jgi:hypothetical protein
MMHKGKEQCMKSMQCSEWSSSQSAHSLSMQMSGTLCVMSRESGLDIDHSGLGESDICMTCGA